MGFGVLFQLLLYYLLLTVFPVFIRTCLVRLQKLVIVGSFSIAAIITPTPDFLNQTNHGSAYNPHLSAFNSSGMVCQP